MQVLDPRGVARGAAQSAANTVTTAPKVIGILNNSKANAGLLFDEVEVFLASSLPDARIFTVQKPSAGNGCPPEMFEALVREAEFVITGTAD